MNTFLFIITLFVVWAITLIAFLFYRRHTPPNLNNLLYKKCTTGAVIQRFNDCGECVGQHFISDNGVEYFYADCEINQEDMPLAGREYFPFNMEQP